MTLTQTGLLEGKDIFDVIVQRIFGRSSVTVLAPSTSRPGTFTPLKYRFQSAAATSPALRQSLFQYRRANHSP
ncbi:MAG: hypothetical protein EOO81_08295 [Oxalobacteraceae bacterium]|nr:MAG: hypothetical protein EOO81_08295 [Oxalobacteraceae bacterium]